MTQSSEVSVVKDLVGKEQLEKFREKYLREVQIDFVGSGRRTTGGGNGPGTLSTTMDRGRIEDREEFIAEEI